VSIPRKKGIGPISPSDSRRPGPSVDGTGDHITTRMVVPKKKKKKGSAAMICFVLRARSVRKKKVAYIVLPVYYLSRPRKERKKPSANYFCRYGESKPYAEGLVERHDLCAREKRRPGGHRETLRRRGKENIREGFFLLFLARLRNKRKKAQEIPFPRPISLEKKRSARNGISCSRWPKQGEEREAGPAIDPDALLERGGRSGRLRRSFLSMTAPEEKKGKSAQQSCSSALGIGAGKKEGWNSWPPSLVESSGKKRRGNRRGPRSGTARAKKNHKLNPCARVRNLGETTIGGRKRRAVP